MKIFFIAALLSFFSYSLPQSIEYDSVVSGGIRQIYNLKFTDAEKTFRRLMADQPQNPAGRFFLAMIDWWKILVDLDNESNDDIFFQKIEDVIFQCNQTLKSDPENVAALFFKGGAIGFRGRLRAIRESWLKAADDGREALPIVERAARLDPDNVDVQLGFGIYNYYADVIPDEYPLIKPLMIFFPKGDKEKGIEQLTLVASKGRFAKYEARYFLMTLYYNYEKNSTKASELASLLTGDFPENPVFQRWRGRIAARQGNYHLASEIFRSIFDKADSNYFGYNKKAKREASYYIALQYRYMNNLDSAEYFFSVCEQLSTEVDKKEESGFLINSLLYLGMINDAMGSREKAVAYYDRVLDLKEYGNSHALAREYIKSPYKN